MDEKYFLIVLLFLFSLLGTSSAQEARLLAETATISPPDVNDVDVCAGTTIPALHANGANIRWYSSEETEVIYDARDDITYPTVKLGTQLWMAENLNYGTRIDGIVNAWDNGVAEKYCLANAEWKCDIFGGLYTWDELMQYSSQESTQGLCPEGWHIPSNGEWKQMEIFLGMDPTEADMMKDRGTDQGTQLLKHGGDSGFDALMGGKRHRDGTLVYEGTHATFWTSTAYYDRTISNTFSYIWMGNDPKEGGFSVRCVEDTLDVLDYGPDFLTGKTQAGQYTFYVSQTVGGIESSRAPVTLTIHPSISVKISGESDECQGETVPLDAGSGYSKYTWSTGATGQSINVTSSGNYSVSVEDSKGCEASDQKYITFHQSPQPEISGPTETCQGETVPLDAGSGYSKYTWSTGATSQSINVTSSGNYSVTVEDSWGCEASDQQYVAFYQAPQLEISGLAESCQGETLVLDAGTGYSKYKWSTGATAQSIHVTSSGNYSVTVEDSRGCEASKEKYVTFNQVPALEISGPTESCQGETIVLDAGTGYTNYKWSTGSTSQSVNITSSGTYSVTVTDSKGCKGSDDHHSNFFPLPEVNITGPTTACEGVSVDLDAGDFAEHKWNFGGLTSRKISISETGHYSVQVTDNHGCRNTDAITVFFEICETNVKPVLENISFSIPENALTGSLIGTLQASDENKGQILKYTIETDDEEVPFLLGNQSGRLTIKSPDLINYELKTQYALLVKVQDNGVGQLSDMAIITVDILDVNENPRIVNGPIYINENIPQKAWVATLQVEDEDFGQNHTFEILAGNNADAFQLDASSGQLTVNNPAAMNYEYCPKYELIVEVCDDGTPPLTAESTVEIFLNDLIETYSGETGTSSFSVYPNPTDGLLFVEFEHLVSTKMHIEVFDALGMLYEQEQVRSDVDGKARIQFSFSNSGVYFLKCTTGDEIRVVKVICR